MRLSSHSFCYYLIGTANLHVIQNMVIQGSSEKVDRTIVKSKNVLQRLFIILFFLMCSKTTFLFVKTKGFAVNQLLLHYNFFVFSVTPSTKALVHWQSYYTEMSATAACNSYYCTCLGQQELSYLCCATQCGQGKYSSDFCFSLSPIWTYFR